MAVTYVTSYTRPISVETQTNIRAETLAFIARCRGKLTSLNACAVVARPRSITCPEKSRDNSRFRAASWNLLPLAFTEPYLMLTKYC